MIVMYIMNLNLQIIYFSILYMVIIYIKIILELIGMPRYINVFLYSRIT